MNGNGVMITIVAVIVLALAGWFAYNQGYIGGSDANKQDVEVNVPGGSGY